MPPRHNSVCQYSACRCWPTRTAEALTEASIDLCVSIPIQVTAAARHSATTAKSRKMRRINRFMVAPRVRANLAITAG